MAVSLEALPESLRPRIGPDAPAPMRMMAARALLPMGPDDLFTVLAYLITNESGELAEAARISLADIPRSVVRGALGDTGSPDLLDFAIRQYVADPDLAQHVLLNAATSDDSVEWAARRVSGTLVELIANNQARLMRHPVLIEAIYYNPEAPMAVVTRTFETGVRAGLDLHHIPGFKEIYASIFGDTAGQKLDEAARDGGLESSAAEVASAIVEELGVEARESLQDGLEDDLFSTALKQATVDDEESAGAEAAAEDKANLPMHSLIKSMSVSQKIRTALVGNKTARALLIKDPKPIVALAVLKSPQISSKEIADYCKNRALGDRVMGAIARNPKWCKDRYVRLGLIKHPKAPPGLINRWIRQLSVRELKNLSRSRDVSGHVSKLAKNLLSQRGR